MKKKYFLYNDMFNFLICFLIYDFVIEINKDIFVDK